MQCGSSAARLLFVAAGQCLAQHLLLLRAQVAGEAHTEAHVQRATLACSVPKHWHALRAQGTKQAWQSTRVLLQSTTCSAEQYVRLCACMCM
jgi:hypothetical protein